MTTGADETVRFGPLTIAYDDRVLTPRPWTAMQSQWAAELAAGTTGPLLELCSGAGHIGLLAAELSGRDLVAVDIDPVACSIMAGNAERAGLGDRVEIRCSPLENALAEGETWAVVIADPPWVTSEAIGAFPADPTLAIDGGDDGLAVARACLAACRDHVVGGGHLLVQLGDEAQAELLLAGLDEAWLPGEVRSGGAGESRGVVLELVRT